MKVLFYAFYYPPAPQVGAKRAGAMYDAMINNGLEVTVRASEATSKASGALNEPSPNGLDHYWRKAIPKLNINRYFRSLDRTILTRFFFGNVWRILRREDASVDIVLATYKPSANLVLGWMASKMYGAKLVIDLRDLVSIFGRKKRAWLISAIDEAVDKFLIKRASQVIVVSPTQKAKAEQFYERQVTLIYNGTDPSELEEVVRKSDCDENYIFYAGTLSADRELGKMSQYLDAYNQKSQLTLYVASAQDPKLFGGLSENIEWLGYLPRSQIKVWMSGSKALVILEGREPSGSENIPAKLYEYLGAGKPVMADCYRNSDLVEILKETRCGDHVGNYEQFCEVIENYVYNDGGVIERFTRGAQMAEFVLLLQRESAGG